VEAGRGQPEEDVALAHSARQRLLLLDHPHDEAGEVVVVLGVRPRHLRGLPADEGTAELGARPREPGHDLLDLAGVHLPERDVVEEEERGRPLHEDVVDAVGDEVVADRVVHPGEDRDLDLRAHAVGGGHQDGLAVAREVGPEHAPERADLGQDLRVERRFRQALDARLGRVRRGDVDAGVPVVHETPQSSANESGQRQRVGSGSGRNPGPFMRWYG